MKILTTIFIFLFFLFSCKTESQVNNIKKLKVNSLKTQKTKVKQKNPGTMTIDENFIQKATINKSDSLIWITANMKLDHRLFGFEKPSLNSRKMILISIFTSDVEKNPFHCPYGAYYDSSNMNDIKLKFKEYIGSFVKVDLLMKNKKEVIYFEKKWIEFEQGE